MSLKQRWQEWRDARAEHRETVDEMKFHIEQETSRNIRNGMSPRVARREAITAFGGIEKYAEEVHDDRARAKINFAMSYLDWKLGTRMLFKYPALSIIGGLTLASAIGLVASWFELTMLELYPKIPLDDGDRIVSVESFDAAKFEYEGKQLHDFMAWRDQLTTIEQLGAARTVQRNLITLDDGESQPVMMAEITASAFPLTRVQPLIGRTLTPADEQPSAPDVVVIGHDIWQRRFDGDRSVLGREVQLGRTRATIVGVMPDGFAFPSTHHAWVPMRPTQPAPREGPVVEIFGRLRDDATLKAAKTELNTIGARMATAYPKTHEHLRPNVHLFGAPQNAGTATELLFANLIGWLLLAAACANVATLMFARTAMRESEIVVRNALGASRMRVLGQLFTEALVLTSAAAVVGLTIATFVMRYAARVYMDEARLPFWFEWSIEPVTILYTAFLAVGGAAMVSLLPAIRATGKHVSAGLSRMATGGTSMGFGGVWSAIIVLQVAFSVLSLPFGIAAAVDATKQQQRRVSFPSNTYLTFRPGFDADVAPSTSLSDVIAELSRRMENEPGVARVTYASTLPGASHMLRRIEAQSGVDKPLLVAANTDGNRVRIANVGTAYFDAFDQPLVSGRGFRDTDIRDSASVVVINESMARNIGGNPIGTRVRFETVDPWSDVQVPGPWLEVVGVVRNLGLTPTARGEADYMYLPVKAESAQFVTLRVNGDATSFTPVLRRIATDVEPELRLNSVMPLREVIRLEELPILQLSLVGMGVVILAIIISAACLYALMSVAVARRTREIGIRVAIGATPRLVLKSLFARAAAQVGAGIVVGNILVVVLLSKQMDDVRVATIAPPMIAASVVMALVGFGACLVPGRRALRIQPTDALKEAR